MPIIFACKACGSCHRHEGPWKTASSIPKEIYSIPPSSPVYNVTYVTQSTDTDGTIQASYTAGYLGTFIAGAAIGAILANGTGYYYPPYIGYGAYGYPAYWPYAATYGVGSYYNPYIGAYGVGRGVYGPYGGAAAGAALQSLYRHLCTWSDGLWSIWEVAALARPTILIPGPMPPPDGVERLWFVGAVGRVARERSAYTQHYSNANGTVATAQGSKGGAAAGASTRYGNTAVGKTASGDMYAGHDGNVYKNTGSGWQ